MIIETDRLAIRLLVLTDIDELMGIWGDKEVMHFCGGAGSREQELASLRYYINLQNEKGFSPYGVILKETGALIGVCGFNPPNNGFDAEFMYHFNKHYWGKGYAIEAATACIKHAPQVTSIKRLGASVDPQNRASVKVLEKLGFEFHQNLWCEATGKEELYYQLLL